MLRIKRWWVVLWKLLFLYLPAVSYSQTNIKYVYLETSIYDYLDYLINSGQLIPKFVLLQPYELGRDVNFNGQRAEGDYFERYWHKFYQPDAVSFQVHVADFVKHDRIVYNRYSVSGSVHYSSSKITVANRTAIDQNYKRDVYYAGDLSESKHWLYGRVNDAYLNINCHDFDFFIGRVKRNWGPVGHKSLILSDNPYSYDHLVVNYRRNHFKLSFLYAQLDQVDGISRADPGHLVKNCNRFLVGHRIDVCFSSRLQLAITEMAIYGGPDRDFEFSFMNPLNFYYPVQRNDKKQMNGLWAIDFYYKPDLKFTLYAQLLLDDIIVNNEPGINDRARYPDRLGAMFSMRSAETLIPGLNSELTYNRIWNRTYQSIFTWENYHYRGLGLGYPCASCEELKLKFSYWDFFPLFVQYETVMGRYGNARLTDLFLTVKEHFPILPAHNHFIASLNLNYFASPAITVNAQIKYQHRTDHYSNRFGEKSHFIVTIGLEMMIGKSIGEGR